MRNKKKSENSNIVADDWSDPSTTPVGPDRSQINTGVIGKNRKRGLQSTSGKYGYQGTSSAGGIG